VHAADEGGEHEEEIFLLFPHHDLLEEITKNKSAGSVQLPARNLRNHIDSLPRRTRFCYSFFATQIKEAK